MILSKLILKILFILELEFSFVRSTIIESIKIS
jgi:hypothetical protein